MNDPTDDKAIINGCYAESIKPIFATFYNQYYSAKNAREKKVAEDAFVRGIEIVRAVRDRALELIQPPASPP